MVNINPTPSGFKTLFSRDFPYLPIWDENRIYFKYDVVFYENNFYSSLKDNNTAIPTNTQYWSATNENPQNYISDDDILRAFAEANVNFNSSLFEKQATAEMIYYYLAAHYLVVDINNALNGLSIGFSGLTQSKSVGSVSESYAMPKWVTDSPLFSAYSTTGYGRKYISLIQPYLLGNVFLCRGGTTYD